MSDVPVIVKIVRYLRDTATPSAHDDIITMVPAGQTHVDAALENLVARGIVRT